MPPMMRQIEAPSFTFTPDGLELRDSSGKRLSKARRREMLREVRQGEPHELLLEVTAFRQSMTKRPLLKSQAREANANFAVFDPERLGALARSFKGAVFIRDHARSQAAVGGVIERSEAVEGDGWTEFVMTIRLQAQWAVESALDGTMRTFSIGSAFKKNNLRGMLDSIFCSLCDGPYFGRDCSHYRGQEVKHDETGEIHIVEIVFRNMRGAELSATPFPAVKGTRIDGIRAALTELRTMNEIAKLLGLSEDASKEDITAKVSELLDAATSPAKSPESEGADSDLAERLKDAEAEVVQVKTLLEAERESHGNTQAALTRSAEEIGKLEAQLSEKEAASVDALVSRALAEGRMRPGNEAIEGAIRNLAKHSHEAAVEFVDKLPQTDPVGVKTQAGDEEKSPATSMRKPCAENDYLLTRQEKRNCDQLNISYAAFREANPLDIDEDDDGDED